MFGLWYWFLLYTLAAALLSASRKWARDGVLLTFTASVVSFEHSENSQCLGFWLFPSLNVSAVLPLVDLRESSKMLETPIRLPSVMLLSWKNDPVDWNQSHRNSWLKHSMKVHKIVGIDRHIVSSDKTHSYTFFSS